MSLTPLFISEEHNTESDNTTAPYHLLREYPNYAVYYISSMFVKVQQLKIDVNADHQHEKHELVRLNERLRLFVDKVQQLEQQNARYVAKLADFRQQVSNISVFGAEWNERHIHTHADLMAVNHEKIDYEFEFELFQMQSEIYKQLIHVINQSSDGQHLKLQQELDQSSSTLINLRTSYTKLQKNIEDLHTERGDTFQQYLKVAEKWGHRRKQISELKVSVQTLKNQHVFYKDIRSCAASDSFSMEVFDVKQFWALKWEKMTANIRHDYQLLYASIHHETVIYYEKKMEEVQVELKQAEVEQSNYYQVEMKKLEFIQQTLRLQHEEAQKMYAYEKEIRIKLKATHSKLESEFESILLQHGERFEQQSKDLHILKEKVISMDDNIEEMRRRKINLEGELIIYRRLLELDEEQKKMVVDSTSLVRSTTMRNFVVERQEIASIGIECPVDCTYICLVNHSTSKDADISQWILKRRIVPKTELKYTLPNGTRLPAGGELRIYSKLGADVARLPSNYDIVSHPLRQKLVTNNVFSWGNGDNTETFLFDEYGEEKASCVQTIASEKTIPD